MCTLISNISINKLYISSPKTKYPAIYSDFKIPENFNYTFLKKFLSYEELEILYKIKGVHKINNFLIGRYIAKVAISELINSYDFSAISIEKGIFNFPVVRTKGNENIQVSISYSSDFVCALAFYEKCPMAIDLERVCDKRVQAIKKALNFPIDFTIDYDYKALITSHWTCLEAVGKILKIGISLPFSLYEPKEIKVINKELLTTFKFLHPFKCSSFFISDFVITFSYPSNCSLLHDFV